MKLVFESYLLYLVTRIYKATTLDKNLSETFRVYVFLTFCQRELPSHTRKACVKILVGVVRPGYVMEG